MNKFNIPKEHLNFLVCTLLYVYSRSPLAVRINITAGMPHYSQSLAYVPPSVFHKNHKNSHSSDACNYPIAFLYSRF